MKHLSVLTLAVVQVTWWWMVDGLHWVRSGVANLCVPENDTLATIPLTQLYPNTNDLQCADHAQMMKAMAFTMNSSTSCVLEGVGLGVASLVASFALMPDVLLEMPRYARTYSSPSLGRFASSLAVDNDLGELSMYHSSRSFVHPWWMVDLGQTLQVRVGNVLDTSGNLSSYQLFSTYLGPYNISKGYVTCRRAEGLAGRFVSLKRITNEADHNLMLVDVRVLTSS